MLLQINFITGTVKILEFDLRVRKNRVQSASFFIFATHNVSMESILTNIIYTNTLIINIIQN